MLCTRAALSAKQAIDEAKDGHNETAELCLSGARIWSLRAEFALRHGGEIRADALNEADAAMSHDVKPAERDALCFYADSHNYFGAPAAIYTDNGQIARKALNP